MKHDLKYRKASPSAVRGEFRLNAKLDVILSND